MTTLEIIQKFSGIISMSIVWIILVLYPFFHKDLGYSKETISSLSLKKRNVLNAVLFALVVGCFFQMYFLLYMNSKFSTDVTSFGSILYLSMGVATIIATASIAKYNSHVHFWSSAYYFLIAPLTMIVIGYEAINYNAMIFRVSILLSVLYALMNAFLVLKFRKTNAMFEIVCFFVLSIWTLYITFI